MQNGELPTATFCSEIDYLNKSAIHLPNNNRVNKSFFKKLDRPSNIYSVAVAIRGYKMLSIIRNKILLLGKYLRAAKKKVYPYDYVQFLSLYSTK